MSYKDYISQPFPHTIFGTAGLILAKLAKIYCLERLKSLLHFGDLDLISRSHLQHFEMSNFYQSTVFV